MKATNWRLHVIALGLLGVLGVAGWSVWSNERILAEGQVVHLELAPVDPQHLIFMIWATTQHYADFATQVEAVTGATLQDAAFFEQTVDNVQRMIIEGIRVR